VNGAVFSSPTVAGGLVYAGSSDGNLYAIARSDGEVAWRFSVGGRVWKSPAIVDGAVYFGSHDGHIYAIEEAAP